MKYTDINEQIPINRYNPIYFGEEFRDLTLILPDVYDYYQISNFGNVYHKYTGHMLNPGICGSGYYFVSLSTTNGPILYRVHRLEMMMFKPIQNCEKYDVNHIDGNKLNNFLGNLEWVTRSENVKHAYRIGIHPRTASITEETAKEICVLLEKNIYTNKQIADMLNTTEQVVSGIKQKDSWCHVSKDYTFYQRPGKLFTVDMIRNICEYFENHDRGNLNVNQFCREALKNLNYDYSNPMVDSARKIYTRKYYTNISSKYNF